MNMMKVITVPMHPEGRKFVAIFAAVTAVLWLVWEPLFWLGLGLTIWCYYFFRDPVRSVAQRPGLILSPADGVVSLITKTVPPSDMQLGDKPLTRVSVFMNVFNCHVNRAPMAGTVVAISYHHGKFLNASLDKASEHNERNSITIETADKTRIGGDTDRWPRGAPHCVFHKSGRAFGRGRAVWLDPLWQPFGHFPARRRGTCCRLGANSGRR